MKKSKMIILTTTILLISITTVSALAYHIHDESERLKDVYADDIQEYQSEIDFKIKNDTEDLTRKEIERMKEETEQYLNEQIGIDYNERLNDKSDEIVAKTDEKIKEIKQYIDELLNAE